MSGYTRSDMAIFGWAPSYPLQVYDTPPVIRQGSHNFLDLITALGVTFLKAIQYAAPLDVPLNDTSYMTFSILGSVYHAPDTPGSYISQASSVQTFAYYARFVDKHTVGNIHRYLILTIIYDFMAFTAQLYRRVLKHRVPTMQKGIATVDLSFASST